MTSQLSFFVMSATDGHRQTYIDFFSKLLHLTPWVSFIKLSSIPRLVRAKFVFFGTLDDDFAGFCLVAFVRSIFGRRTAGLFLHPNSCFQPGVRYRLKYLICRLLRHWPGISMISIISADLFPKLRAVARYSVHDPQFWDQLVDGPEPDSAAVQAIAEAAKGRTVLAFIGGITRAKAFPRLAALYASSPDLRRRVHLVVAGHCLEIDKAVLRELEGAGAQIWDRFVSDEEIVAVYHSADWVWLSYAPGYEQASGIFGRSVQHGAPVILRMDSELLGRYAALLGHPVYRLSGDDEVAVEQLQALPVTRQSSSYRTATDASRSIGLEWKKEFLSVVGQSRGSTQGSADD